MIQNFYSGKTKVNGQEVYVVNFQTENEKMFNKVSDKVAGIIHDEYVTGQMIEKHCCPFYKNINGQCDLVNLLCGSFGNCDKCGIKQRIIVKDVADPVMHTLENKEKKPDRVISFDMSIPDELAKMLNLKDC